MATESVPVADLFGVTAPLALRLPDGTRKVMAACFPHPQESCFTWIYPSPMEFPFFSGGFPNINNLVLKTENCQLKTSSYTFWHLASPQDAAHMIVGEVTGEGPWKVGGCVITVLGCQGTDPELALPYARWRDYLEQAGPGDYPPQAQIRDIARPLGAAV